MRSQGWRAQVGYHRRPGLYGGVPHSVAANILDRHKRRVYNSRAQARQDVFDYIEMFYNPIRRHSHAANLSPINYERYYFSEAMICL